MDNGTQQPASRMSSHIKIERAIWIFVQTVIHYKHVLQQLRRDLPNCPTNDHSVARRTAGMYHLSRPGHRGSSVLSPRFNIGCLDFRTQRRQADIFGSSPYRLHGRTQVQGAHRHLLVQCELRHFGISEPQLRVKAAVPVWASQRGSLWTY